MPELCYPQLQVSTPNMCQRELVLEKVKRLVQEMGDRGVQDARPALCRREGTEDYASLTYQPPVSREADECICSGESRPYKEYFQTVTMDGQLGRPVLPYSAVYKPIKYCPPCDRKKPDMDEKLGCYTTGGRKKHNLSYQPTGKCAGQSLCMKAGYPWGQKGYRRTSHSVGGDLGQTCPERNIHSVCTSYECPPDPRHRHWSPTCTNCNYPNACYASCFEHPTYKDWVYRQPGYRFYLQKRCDRPFMAGY